MSSIKGYLDSKKVRTFSLAGLTTDIGIIMKESKDECAIGEQIFKVMLDYDQKFDDELYARISVKKLMVELYYMKFELDCEVKSLVQKVLAYAQHFCDDPAWSFLKSNEKDIIDEEGNVILKPMQEVRQQVVEGITTKVAIKTDAVTGKTKIKKGGKRILCLEMYRKHVVDEGMSNKDFVKLIIEKLDLTQAGANTYAWNCKSGAWS
ncbi:MAG: hypothetical protein EO766_17640 [Hydrotalea sp. AMD]|uniref:hypothetical protein n=1 Tax=Hydrotalea sp. AMD TaxID=2501297 RepID=UPI001024F325|nr:hypothetical protein [Hydrotalea sp. AMD]RWZ83508.1 MAG: hypothetical protein EO766_17640 [Hydrotalea sp. AMD]